MSKKKKKKAKTTNKNNPSNKKNDTDKGKKIDAQKKKEQQNIHSHDTTPVKKEKSDKAKNMQDAKADKKESSASNGKSGRKDSTIQGEKTGKIEKSLAPSEESGKESPADVSQKDNQSADIEPNSTKLTDSEEKKVVPDKDKNAPEMEKFKKIVAPSSAQENDKNTGESTPSNSVITENNLELSTMTKKERRAARRAKNREFTKDMSKGERFLYYFDYYKWAVIIPIICIIFVAYCARTIYKNTRPVALGYVVLNVSEEHSVDTSFEDDFVDYIHMTGSYQFYRSAGLDIDYDYFLEHKEYITTSNSTDYNILSTECEVGDFDVIISNTTGIRFCSAEGIAKTLKGYFDSEAYQLLEPYMVEFPDQYGTNKAYAIDISDTEFAKSLKLEYDDIYLAFPGASDRNLTNSLKLLEYIFGIELNV